MSINYPHGLQIGIDSGAAQKFHLPPPFFCDLDTKTGTMLFCTMPIYPYLLLLAKYMPRKIPIRHNTTLSPAYSPA